MKLICLLSAAYLFASEPRERYLTLLDELEQSNGSYLDGEIEIVVDPDEIDRVQSIQKSRLLKKGIPEEEADLYSRIGVVSEDIYWIWIRDAVYFPNKVPGTYDRLLSKEEAKAAAILPLLGDGRIVLNLNYRHATRSWELELPRGGGNRGETSEETAARELKEETGLDADSISFLGEIMTDSGVSGAAVPVYLARVSTQGLSKREESEAIAGVIAFTLEEIKEGLAQGYLEVPLNGAQRKIPLRDAFLTFALLQAEIRKIL